MLNAIGTIILGIGANIFGMVVLMGVSIAFITTLLVALAVVEYRR
jgi:hypothetical protein